MTLLALHWSATTDAIKLRAGSLDNFLKRCCETGRVSCVGLLLADQRTILVLEPATSSPRLLTPNQPDETLSLLGTKPGQGVAIRRGRNKATHIVVTKWTNFEF